MYTKLFWIDGPWQGKLAISARPRGSDWLDDEMRAWRMAGVDAVVSLLTPDEAEDLGLERERAESEANRIEFFSLPIVDRSTPASESEVARLLNSLDRRLREGKNVAIHCRQGIGRSSLISAALLVETGVAPAEAFAIISRARGVPVPETPEQAAWLDSFAAELKK
jgi:protein-tyrosine phosphatase